MALTGHLSDLSLSELIEFFCNQRKVGLLCVHYPKGSGYFFLQNGSVVDAKIGLLRGIDAVYYALTLPNAAFEFKAAEEPPERTINQPWTQVVLEGLRRLDEGIEPAQAFVDEVPAAPAPEKPAAAAIVEKPARVSSENLNVPAFLSMMAPSSLGHRKPVIIGLAAFAVLVSVAVIGVPAGWYARAKAPVAAIQPATPLPSAPQPEEVKQPATQPQPGSNEADVLAAEATANAAKRQKEKERAKARDEKNSAAIASRLPPTGNDGKPGTKKVTVQVTYDESGRVVQASGADPTALRIARQKRFPAGKGGTATITIPIN